MVDSQRVDFALRVDRGDGYEEEVHLRHLGRRSLPLATHGPDLLQLQDNRVGRAVFDSPLDGAGLARALLSGPVIFILQRSLVRVPFILMIESYPRKSLYFMIRVSVSPMNRF